MMGGRVELWVVGLFWGEVVVITCGAVTVLPLPLLFVVGIVGELVLVGKNDVEIGMMVELPAGGLEVDAGGAWLGVDDCVGGGELLAGGCWVETDESGGFCVCGCVVD